MGTTATMVYGLGETTSQCIGVSNQTQKEIEKKGAIYYLYYRKLSLGDDEVRCEGGDSTYSWFI